MEDAMNLLTTILAIVSPISAMIVAWLAFGRNKKQDTQEAAGSLAMMQSDIGYIKAGNDDIKRQLRDQDKRVAETSERSIRNEDGLRRANARLDKLEKHAGFQ